MTVYGPQSQYQVPDDPHDPGGRSGRRRLLAKKFLIKESPEKYVAYGQVMMAEKKYPEAVKNFQMACSLDPRNPSLWVAYGDALNQLSPNDLEMLTKARRAWENALAVAPDNKPALDRMMQFWSDAANLDPNSPQVFDQLNATAKKLFAADPRNVAAEVAVYSSVIRPWLAGVETDTSRITEAVAKLEALMERDPDNAELPMFVAQAKLRLAERAAVSAARNPPKPSSSPPKPTR